jgi:RimJ/RimL family protein N-acetyltransferase
MVHPPQPRAERETVTLRDGTQVIIRGIRPDDAPRLQDLFHRLSPESIYFRFLGRPKDLPLAQAERLANVDCEQCMAFVATHGRDDVRDIVAVARYAQVAGRPGLAEAGVVVEDQYQGRGLGTLLLKRLTAYAREHGVQAFYASVHPANNQILRFIQRSGLPTESRLEAGVWEMHVYLDRGGEKESDAGHPDGGHSAAGHLDAAQDGVGEV